MNTLLQELLLQLNENDDVNAQPAASANPVPANPVSAEPVDTVSKASPDEVIDESQEYEDSSEFTAEFYSLFSKLEEVKKIVQSAKFKHWMQATDTNFSTDVMSLVPSVEEGITALEASLKALEEEISKADE